MKHNDQNIDEITEEFEKIKGSLDELIDLQRQKAETAGKKATIYGVLWSAVAAVIYLFAGAKWYFWVAFVIALVLVATSIFANTILKKKLKSIDDSTKRYERNKSAYDNDIGQNTPRYSIVTKLFGKSTYDPQNGLDLESEEITLNGRTHPLHGAVFEELPDKEIKKAVKLIDALEELDAKAREFIKTKYEQKDETILDYIELLFEDLPEVYRKKLYKKLNLTQRDDMSLLKGLELGNFYVDFEDEESLIITLDYAPVWEDGISFCDYIIAVRFDEEMHILEYAMES